MKKAINKGTEEAEFWFDLMKFRQIWYTPTYDDGKPWEPDSKEWEKFVDSVDRFSKKYSGELENIAREMILAYAAFFDKEAVRLNEQRRSS